MGGHKASIPSAPFPRRATAIPYLYCGPVALRGDCGEEGIFAEGGDRDLETLEPALGTLLGPSGQPVENLLNVLAGPQQNRDGVSHAGSRFFLRNSSLNWWKGSPESPASMSSRASFTALMSSQVCPSSGCWARQRSRHSSGEREHPPLES